MLLFEGIRTLALGQDVFTLACTFCVIKIKRLVQ